MEERRRRLPSKWKSKVFKPTVVMYDGLVISKGGGRVKVPRRAPYARGREYDKWQNLRSEALRQENEALRVESENQRAKQEWQKKMNGPADESETRKVLYAGIVTVKSM